MSFKCLKAKELFKSFDDSCSNFFKKDGTFFKYQSKQFTFVWRQFSQQSAADLFFFACIRSPSIFDSYLSKWWHQKSSHESIWCVVARHFALCVCIFCLVFSSIFITFTIVSQKSIMFLCIDFNITLQLLLTMIMIILDVFNQKQLIDILEKFITFDKKVCEKWILFRKLGNAIFYFICHLKCIKTKIAKYGVRLDYKRKRRDVLMWCLISLSISISSQVFSYFSIKRNRISIQPLEIFRFFGIISLASGSFEICYSYSIPLWSLQHFQLVAKVCYLIMLYSVTYL